MISFLFVIYRCSYIVLSLIFNSDGVFRKIPSFGPLSPETLSQKIGLHHGSSSSTGHCDAQ